MYLYIWPIIQERCISLKIPWKKTTEIMDILRYLIWAFLFVPATWQKKGFVLPWNEEIGEKGCVLWQEQKKKIRAFRHEKCQGDGKKVSYQNPCCRLGVREIKANSMVLVIELLHVHEYNVLSSNKRFWLVIHRHQLWKQNIDSISTKASQGFISQIKNVIYIW